MDDPESRFEIIEDEPPEEKPKRKRKRKYRPFFGHMPWRLLGVTFIGGILVASIVLGGLLLITSSSTNPIVITSTAIIPPLIATRSADEAIYRVAWAGDTLAAASSQALRVYPPGSAPIALYDEGFAEALTVSPDGKQVAVLWTVYPKSAADSPSLTNPIDIWDVASGRKVRRIEAHTFSNMSSFYGAATAALAYSPDGARLASGSKDGQIRVWDVQTGTAWTELPTDGASSTLALAFSADGQHLAAVLRYGEGVGDPGTHDELRVWSSPYYQPEPGVNLQLQAVSRAVFSPDGRTLGLIADGGRFIDIRDVITGVSLGEVLTGPDGIARELTLGSDHLLGVIYFRAGIATAEPGLPGGDRIELRAMRWQLGNSFDLVMETVASKADYLYLGDIAALHFEPDEQRLDYVPQTGSTVWRWNLETGEISPFDL